MSEQHAESPCSSGERHRDEYHVAAISLNNSAVSLLAHGEYWSAMKTLKDAIQFMEKAVLNRTKSKSDTMVDVMDHEGTCARQQALERASHLTSRRHVAPSVTEHTGSWSSLEVVSCQSDPSRILRLLSSGHDSGSRHRAFPFTIDPIDFDSCTIDDVSLDSGVVLYNYGIALDYAASTKFPSHDDAETTAFPHEMIQVKARNVYQNTYLVLFEIEQHCNGRLPICLASQILLLRTVLTHNLIHVSIKLNLSGDYDYYCCVLQRLLLLVEAQQSLVPVNDRAVASAA